MTLKAAGHTFLSACLFKYLKSDKGIVGWDEVVTKKHY